MELNFGNVDRFVSQVDLVVPQPVLDLTNVTFFRPFGLIYLGMFLRHYNSLGKVFAVELPRSPAPRAYLAQMRFYERFNFDPRTVQQEKLLRFTSTTSLNDIVDLEKVDGIAEYISDNVLRVLRMEIVRVNKTLIAEVVAELVDNFARHSESSLGAFAMQYYPRLRRVIFAIGDCGVGIRCSLSSNPAYAYLNQRPHTEAALKAFEPLVSRTNEGGTGLLEVAEAIVKERGRLVLATGDGYVRMVSGRTETGSMCFDLPGVQIELSFPER